MWQVEEKGLKDCVLERGRVCNVWGSAEVSGQRLFCKITTV